MSETVTYQKSERAILEAALVVFTNNPAASVEEIIVAADVSRATFYKFFASKQAVLVEVALYSMYHIDELLIDYFTDDSNSATDKLMYTFEKVIPLGERYTFLTSFPSLDTNKKVAEYEQQQLQGLKDTIAQAQADGVIRRDLPTTWLVELFDMLIYTGWKTLSTGDVSLKEVIKLSQRAFADCAYVHSVSGNLNK
jgi:AcrR family transcriptional regulator